LLSAEMGEKRYSNSRRNLSAVRPQTEGLGNVVAKRKRPAGRRSHISTLTNFTLFHYDVEQAKKGSAPVAHLDRASAFKLVRNDQ